MEKIVIDVGGYHYATTKQTLKMSPLFKNVQDGDFIDRDGTFFYYILNAMRGSTLFPSDAHIAEHVREEAYFYGLTEYAQHIKRRYS